MLFFWKRNSRSERRESARAEPEDRILAAELVFGGRRSLGVRVLDSSFRGARVELCEETARLPDPESELVLALTISGEAAPRRVAARVVRVAEVRVVALLFTDPDRDLADLDRAARSLFDRRRHPRHRLTEEVFVDFAIGALRVCGRLLDIAEGGLAMRLAPGCAGRLTPTLRGVLEFRLPRDFRVLRLPAEIRWRRDDDGETRLGLRFRDDEDCEGDGKAEEPPAPTEDRERLREFLAELEGRA